MSIMFHVTWKVGNQYFKRFVVLRNEDNTRTDLSRGSNRACFCLGKIFTVPTHVSMKTMLMRLIVSKSMYFTG